MWYNHHLSALLNAVASSTDNFLVGLLLLDGKLTKQHHTFVWAIAICNAIGSLAATAAGGSVLSQSTSFYWNNNILSALAFAYLGYQEAYQNNSSSIGNSSSADNNNTRGSQVTKVPVLSQLALPMTLNNLAGGVTTGVAGVPYYVAAGYTLLVSSITMYIGAWVRQSLEQKRKAKNDTTTTTKHTQRARYLAVLLYVILGFKCLVDAHTN